MTISMVSLCSKTHTPKMFNWTVQNLRFWLHLRGPINRPREMLGWPPACSQCSCSGCCQ